MTKEEKLQELVNTFRLSIGIPEDTKSLLTFEQYRTIMGIISKHQQSLNSEIKEYLEWCLQQEKQSNTGGFQVID